MPTAAQRDALAIQAALAFQDAPDRCDITLEVRTPDDGGGYVLTTTTPYEDVPLIAEPVQKFGWTKEQAEQITQTQIYILHMPTVHEGVAMNLGPEHTIVQRAAGLQPQRRFTIVSPGNVLGIVYQIQASEVS